MADKVIGIDVGTNAVRAAEVVLGAPPRLVRFGQVGLPAGSVHEGEVVDVDAVAAALRRLWREAGFTGRRVRVGMASARVIVRVVELPLLSDADTASTLRLQLADYVPLPPESTLFDFQPLEAIPPTGTEGEEAEEGQGALRRLLLAAAHEDAVCPLVEAIAKAGLKLDAVDVIPAALARALAPGADGEGPVEAVVSVGAGLTVVVVARAGTPLFTRTVTSVAGRRVTEQIAAELSVSTEDAERRKRGVPEPDEAGEAPAMPLVAGTHASELVSEVTDSLTYYRGLPGARHIERAVVTGGGSLLAGLPELLEERLGVPVAAADPLAGVVVGDLGFEPEDLPFLAPYLSAALGVALGGGRSKAKRIDLSPARAATRVRRRPILVGGAALVLLLGVVTTYVQRSGAIDDERAAAAAAQAEIAALREADAAPDTEGGERTPASLWQVVEAARARDADWLAVVRRLDAVGAPLGVQVATLQGTTEAMTEQADAIGDDAGASGEAAGAQAGSPEAASLLGRVSLTGTAPSLQTVAGWVDAIEADDHFGGAWVSGVTAAQGDGGGVQFVAEVTITRANLVPRSLMEVPAQ